MTFGLLRATINSSKGGSYQIQCYGNLPPATLHINSGIESSYISLNKR